MIPPGFKFDPTDEELLTFYLPYKVNGIRLPCDPCIECDIYNANSNHDGREEACAWKEVFNRSGETTHYFFTKLIRKNEKGKRIERTSGSGTWKTQQERVIKSGRGKIIGFKRLLSFVPQKKPYFPTSAEDEFQWVMHEYRLPEEESSNAVQQNKGYVICRIKKRGKPKGKDTCKTYFSSSSGDGDNANNIMEGQIIGNINHEIGTSQQESEMTYLSDNLEYNYTPNKSDQTLFTPNYSIPMEPISTIIAPVHAGKGTCRSYCPSSYGDEDHENNIVEGQFIGDISHDIGTSDQEIKMAYMLKNSDETLIPPNNNIPIEPISAITATVSPTSTGTPVTTTSTVTGTSPSFKTASTELSTEDLLASISWEYDPDEDFGVTWQQ